MGTAAGIGRSTSHDPGVAGREAISQALAALGGSPPQFVLVFATSGYDPVALLEAIRERVPDARLSGCSGEGVIAGPTSDEGLHAVAVLAVRSDTLGFDTFLIRAYSADSAAAGRELARQVRAAGRADAIGLMVFPEGLHGNCGELLRTIDAELPGLPVVGGAAGDALVFQHTHQYHGGGAYEDALAAVLIHGRGRLELAVSHGCTPIGLERRITRADGGWLREIDGQPAWSVFREYLDGEPEDLDTEAAVHLSIGEPLPADAAAGYEPFIIHTPLGLDKTSGSMFFPGGGLRDGGAIRLARRDPVKIRDSARACAARIADRRAGQRPALVLQFDCAGRGKQMFGTRTAEAIVQPLQDVLGHDTPWIGFHTFGEIAPIGQQTFYHNFTVSLCALFDEP